MGILPAQAAIRIEPMGNGQYGTVSGGILYSCADKLFCPAVQVSGDFIQQQNLRVSGNRTRNGEQLPLSL